VKDVARSTAFYTEYLGFTVKHQQLPAFANVALGDAQILLSGPGASGSRPMPNGQQQEPGGWNRVVLKVADLPGFIAELKQAGLHFRNEMETGPGGRQIQIEDPDGNPIELFEPAGWCCDSRQRGRAIVRGADLWGSAGWLRAPFSTFQPRFSGIRLLLGLSPRRFGQIIGGAIGALGIWMLVMPV
jgi:glyoxylase I family protein